MFLLAEYGGGGTGTVTIPTRGRECCVHLTSAMFFMTGQRTFFRIAAMCVLPSLVSGAPVAVNDTYAVNEDAVLNTSAAALFSANFEPGTNVVGGERR